ncbi:hypothetical protein HUB94_02395 (plasmid) [Paenibacillus cellulosilyticus]|nr:hypothetical protein HUB94_02395 [Paenibacillus cellulosilyticus]
MFPVHKLEWHKLSNVLTHLSGVDVHDKDSDFYGDVAYGGHLDKMTGKPGEPQVKRFELMQYTGMKDKNGKEIYEGDILTAESYPFQDDGQYNYHGVIEWIDCGAAFYMTKHLVNPNKRGISDGISEPIDEGLEEFVVIGNIYEYPQLLAGDSK